jgi:hypothetical protein
MKRAAVAKIGSMDRQTLRDWVHRFNASTTAWKCSNGIGGCPLWKCGLLTFWFRPSADLKVAVSGRGTGRAVRNYKDVSPNWS